MEKRFLFLFVCLLTSRAAAQSGTVSPAAADQTAYYSSAGSTISGYPATANGIPVTNGLDVPSVLPTVPSTSISRLTASATTNISNITSGAQAKPPTLSIESNRLGGGNLLDCGGKDDGITDNIAAFNTCKAKGLANSAGGTPLTIQLSRSSGGTGQFYVSTTPNLANVVIQESGIGVRFTGPGSAGLLIVGSTPQGSEQGYRYSAPGYDEAKFGPVGNPSLKQEYTHMEGFFGSPYDGFLQRRSFALVGQFTPTAATWGGDQLQENIYAPTFDGRGNWISGESNGNGITLTCQATKGQTSVSGCVVASSGVNPLTAINPATARSYFINDVNAVFFAGSPDTGIPLGSGFTPSGAAGATIQLLTPGTFTTPYPWPLASGTVILTVVSGHAEHNAYSAHINAVGNLTTSGLHSGEDQGYYNEWSTETAISTNPANQEAFLSSGLFQSFKFTPGNIHDPLHTGSDIISAVTYAQNTYMLDAGIAVSAYAGPAGTAGGDATRAIYGAYNGIQIGGNFYTPYQHNNVRSYFNTGLDIEDYEGQAIHLRNPMLAHSNFSGNAVVSDTGAGNWRIGDNLFVNGGLNLGPATSIGGVGSANIVMAAAAGSARAGEQIGSNWLFGTDSGSNGTANLFFYDIGTGKAPFAIDTADHIEFATLPTSATGLPSKTVWANGTVLNITP